MKRFKVMSMYSALMERYIYVKVGESYAKGMQNLSRAH